ncbi:MAG: hypothetical protein JXB46_05635 [Candidatus Eisenbacteria bacterium]|nr:hypothetical protein [Candidatus Eisenbacteria bacterium]
MAMRKSRKPVGLLLLALVCLAVGAAAIGGLFLRDDAPGRALFGAAWGALGIVWLGKYAGSGRSTREQDDRRRA